MRRSNQKSAILSKSTRPGASASGARFFISFHFARSAPRPDGVVAARIERAGADWRVIVCADRLLRFVHIADDAFRPDADRFTLAPDQDRVVNLTRRLDTPLDATPSADILLPGGRFAGHCEVVQSDA